MKPPPRSRACVTSRLKMLLRHEEKTFKNTIELPVSHWRQTYHRAYSYPFPYNVVIRKSQMTPTNLNLLSYMIENSFTIFITDQSYYIQLRPTSNYPLLFFANFFWRKFLKFFNNIWIIWSNIYTPTIKHEISSFIYIFSVLKGGCKSFVFPQKI